MNAGFVALWLITIVVILLATGWKEMVADHVKSRSMLLLASGCALLSPFYITLSPSWLPPVGGTVRMSICWLAVWAIGAAMAIRSSRALQRFYMTIAALLCSLMGGWLQLLYLNDPVLIIGHASIDAAILTGAAAALSAPIQAKSLFAVVTAASIMQPIFMGWFAAGMTLRPLEIGSLAWWDGYMVALLAARLMGLSIRAVKLGAAKWLNPPEGEQEGGV